jgi:hypothetical protein
MNPNNGACERAYSAILVRFWQSALRYQAMCRPANSTGALLRQSLALVVASLPTQTAEQVAALRSTIWQDRLGDCPAAEREALTDCWPFWARGSSGRRRGGASTGVL